MPKVVKPLSEAALKRAKSDESTNTKLSDGGGLYLLIDKNGAKLWRFDYTRPITKKRNTLSFGSYPMVTLAEARDKRDEARKLVSQGIDPSEQKRLDNAKALFSASNTFEVVADEWYARQDVSEKTQEKNLWLITIAKEKLGRRPINEITAMEILAVCRQPESEGKLEKAKNLRTKIGQVFRYAVVTGRCERDPTQDLRGALKTPHTNHLAAITDPFELVDLLRDIDQYHGQFVTRSALKMSPYVFVRPVELRKALWSDIDLEKRLWGYTPPKTKNSTAVQLLVPLADQVVEILKELQPYRRGSIYVFPAIHTTVRPMSENTINQALRRMDYSGEEMCGHGFRATARTILEEELHYPIEIIEQQLGHMVKDMHGRAYNRTKHLIKRREMMQAWANYLDALKASGT